MLIKSFAITLLMLLITGCSQQPEPETQVSEEVTENPVKAVEAQYIEANKKVITATVKYIDLEGGFYGLVTDDGERYLPTNLAAEFQTDGTVLMFKTIAVNDVATIQQWGTLVELYEVKAKQIAEDSEI